MLLKTSHWYLIKSYLGPLILTFFIAIFILLMQFLWRYIDDLIGKGLDWKIIAKLIFYASGSFVTLALPLAVLLSSIMVFGNMGEHFELIAFKSAGVSLYRIMKPLIMLVVFLSIGTYFYANYTMPVTHLKFISLLYDIRKQKVDMDIRPGIFSPFLDDYVIKTSNKNQKTEVLEDVIIYDHSKKKGNTDVTVAKTATMKINKQETFFILTLNEGKTYKEDKDVKGKKIAPIQVENFQKKVIKIPLDGLQLNRTDEKLFKNNASMMNVRQLREKVKGQRKSLGKKQKNYRISLKNSHLYVPKKQKDKNEEIKILNTDSLYQILSKEKRQRSIAASIQQVRNNQKDALSQGKTIESNQKLIAKYQMEWHKKFALSFTCLVFFFIGAPFGAIIRKGGLGMPLVIAIMLFLVYYIISVSGEKMAKELEVSVYKAMWASSIILFPLGIFLTYKAAKDSTILNIDAYILFYKRIKRYFIKGE